MALVALLSNPRSTGNQSLLPQVRAFCAEEKDVFHYEVEEVGQIGAYRLLTAAIGEGDPEVARAAAERVLRPATANLLGALEALKETR